MNIPEIEAFVALAETGSVNRAALRLNLTQPAVTRRIQSFEATMGGTALLDRRNKPSILTPEGRRVLESCRQVLKAMADLKRNGSNGPLSGDVRLGIAHGLAKRVLEGPIDALKRRFPSIRPIVISHWTTWLVEQVRNGALDCAVGLLTDDATIPANIHSTAISVERIAVVAANDAPISSTNGRLSLRDVAEFDWILNPHGCGYRNAIQRAFDQTNIPLRITAEILGHDLQLSLVARGVGLGLVPRQHIESSPYRRRLRVLKLTDFDLQATIAMLHAGSLGRLTPVIEHFQDALGSGATDDASRASS